MCWSSNRGFPVTFPVTGVVFLHHIAFNMTLGRHICPPMPKLFSLFIQEFNSQSMNRARTASAYMAIISLLKSPSALMSDSYAKKNMNSFQTIRSQSLTSQHSWVNN